jgi:hypothetical protein
MLNHIIAKSYNSNSLPTEGNGYSLVALGNSNILLQVCAKGRKLALCPVSSGPVTAISFGKMNFREGGRKKSKHRFFGCTCGKLKNMT